jgi:hypothetical protein
LALGSLPALATFYLISIPACYSDRLLLTHFLNIKKIQQVPLTVTATFEFFIIIETQKETDKNGRFPARTLNLKTEVHHNWLWFAW